MKLWRSREEPRGVDVFEFQHQQLLHAHTLPKTGIPPYEVMVNKPVYDWVRTEAALVARKANRADIWNTAINLAMFRLLAEDTGREPFLIAPQTSGQPGKHHNLPPLPDHVAHPDDVSMRFTPALEGYNAALWALREDSGVFPEDLVDNGVRILGALALMPEGSAIAVNDKQGGIYAKQPMFTVAGADPYPADLRFL
jgi:hypothetical protein